MAKKNKIKQFDDETIAYGKRNMNRKGTVQSSVMSLVGYFISQIAVDPLNPTEAELDQAADQVDEISYDLISNNCQSIVGYERGNKRSKSDLLVAVDNLSIITYPYMTDEAKLVLTNILNQL